MAATIEEINNFQATIMSVTSNIGNKLTTALSISGREENEVYFNKFRAINTYVNILLDYFSRGVDYETYNFFTVDEIYEIIERFNDLSNTDYTISL
jgi:hypothetical protein